MVVDGAKHPAKFKWLRDPRGSATDADLVEQFKFAQKISARLTEANDSVGRIRTLRTNLDKALEEAKAKGSLGGLETQAGAFKSGISLVEQAIYQTQNKSGQDPLNYPIRLNDKLAGVFSTVVSGNFRPTEQSYEVFERLSAELEVHLKELRRLESTDLKAINAELEKRGVKPVVAN
jgi:hypothetical protein